VTEPEYKAVLPNLGSLADLRFYGFSGKLATRKLSPDGDEVADNSARASWAATALSAFAERTNMTEAGEDIETAMCDLLCDLRHLCDAAGLDWHDAEFRAMSTYRDEVRGIW